VAELTEAELEAQLQAGRAGGNLQAQAGALDGLATAARARGDRAAAVELYQQAGMLWQELKSWQNMLATLINLAALYSDLEDNDAAYRSARAATELAQKVGDLGGMATAVNTLGVVADHTGDIETARSAYTKSLELARSAADQVRVVRALYNLGWVAFTTGDYAQARHRTREAAEALGGAVEPVSQAYVSMLAGRLDIRQHAYERAQQRLGWAARAFHYAGHDEDAALASFAFGTAEYLAGERESGRARIEATFEGIRLHRNRRATAERLIGLSRLAAEAGAVEDAQAFGQLARNIGSHLSDPAIEAQAQQLLTGGIYAGAADPGIIAAAAQLEVRRASGEIAEAPGAGEGPDLAWLEHDFGVAPPPPPALSETAPPGTEYVGPIRVVHPAPESASWSIQQDVAGEIGVPSNRDAQASLMAVLRRRDPRLLDRLVFENGSGGLSIVSKSYDDIRVAAAWLASMFRSAAGA
jgi:tetratricopeptide (TPR) repeat protein